MLVKTAYNIKNKLNYTNYIKIHQITLNIHQITKEIASKYIKYTSKTEQNKEQRQNRTNTHRKKYLPKFSPRSGQYHMDSKWTKSD